MELCLEKTSKELLMRLHSNQNETKQCLKTFNSCGLSSKYQPEEKSLTLKKSDVSKAKEKLKSCYNGSQKKITPKSDKLKGQSPLHLHSEKRCLPSVDSDHVKRQCHIQPEDNPSKALYDSPSNQKLDRSPDADIFDDSSRFVRQWPDISNDPGSLLVHMGNLRPQFLQDHLDDRSDAEPREARRERLHSILTRSAILRKTPPSRTHLTPQSPSSRPSPPSYRSHTLADALLDAPVEVGESPSALMRETSRMGYDWIAGMLENKEATALDQSESFYEELRQFRKQNSNDCFAKSYRDEAYAVADHIAASRLTGPEPRRVRISELQEVRELEEPVFAYTVNDRLFAVPVDAEAAARLNMADSEPQIIKVSIPTSRLRNGINGLTSANANTSKFASRFRQTVCGSESGETVALVNHCQLGYHMHRPGSLATATGGVGAFSQGKGEPADLRAATGVRELLRQQPATQAEAVAQLKRGIAGSRRQRVGVTGELPVPDDLLLDEAGGRGTVAARLARNDIMRAPHSANVGSSVAEIRQRVMASRSRISDMYRDESGDMTIY